MAITVLGPAQSEPTRRFGICRGFAVAAGMRGRTPIRAPPCASRDRKQPACAVAEAMGVMGWPQSSIAQLEARDKVS